jgi:hypothetical protein
MPYRINEAGKRKAGRLLAGESPTLSGLTTLERKALIYLNSHTPSENYVYANTIAGAIGEPSGLYLRGPLNGLYKIGLIDKGEVT